MSTYEGLIILHPNTGEEKATECLKKIEETLTKHNAKNIEQVNVGRKPLGFMMKKQVDGVFVKLAFQADGSKVKDIQYGLRLLDFILHLTIFVKSKKSVKQEVTA